MEEAWPDGIPYDSTSLYVSYLENGIGFFGRSSKNNDFNHRLKKLFAKIAIKYTHIYLG